MTRSKLYLSSGRDRHLPDTDLVITVSSEQGLTVSGPGHGQALGRLSLGVGVVRDHIGLELINHVLTLKILHTRKINKY